MKLDILGRVVIDDVGLLKKINGAVNLLELFGDNSYCPHVNSRCVNVPCPDKACQDVMCTCRCYDNY